MKKSTEEDIEKLKSYSETNINLSQCAVGEEATKLVPVLIDKFLSRMPLSIFHETKSASNIEGILKEGQVYSYELLQDKKLDHAAGMTVPAEQEAQFSANVIHIPDQYTNFVYCRPRFGKGAEEATAGNGFYLDMKKIPPQAWISFRDPNQVDRSDIEMSMFHSVIKAFNSYDVFMGEHIREGIVLRALELMVMAQCIHEHSQKTEKPMTMQKVLDDYILPPYDGNKMEILSGKCYDASHEGVPGAPWIKIF